MKTALYDKHVECGAKIVDFSGWEMPLHYGKGIVYEHLSVRQKLGIFDVSHMGTMTFKGKDAESLLDHISTNKIVGKRDGTATYTVWATQRGGAIDDVIVYQRKKDDFFVVVNAGNRQKDLSHVLEEAKSFHVEVQDSYDEDGILALQGPRSLALLEDVFPDENLGAVEFMQFKEILFSNESLIVSRVGYTGSLGYEVYASNILLRQLWDIFMENGKKLGIEPIGLGARDTLRLEMGYALYGNELSERIAPTESVSSWAVKLKKKEFLGKSALEQLERSPSKRMQYGIVLSEKGIARVGYEVIKSGQHIGTVTSGTFSPCLKKSIAIILAEGKLQEGDNLHVRIRKNLVKGQVVRLPFVDPKVYQ